MVLLLAIEYGRGDHAGANKQFEEALACYVQIIARWPTYTAVYMSRGRAYANLGDSERASADFIQAITLSNQPRIRQEAARARAKLG